MSKFKNKKGKIIVTNTMYAEKLLKNNPDYAEIKEKEPKVVDNTSKGEKTQEVANKPL